MTTPVFVDPRNPEAALGQISEADQARYRQMYVPVEDLTIASLDNTDIIDQARQSASRGFDRAPGRAMRDLRRYGVSVTGADREAAEVGFAMNKALGVADSVNTARLDQFDRNRTLRNELINVGRGFSTDALGMLSEAAGMQSQRNANNRAMKAQQKASYINTAGSLAASAIFAAMVM